MSLRSTLLLLALLAPPLLAQAPLDDADDPTGQAPADDAFLPEGIEATGDTAEVRALHAWAYEHRRTDSEQARQVAERALALAQNLNDQKGIGECLSVLGHIAKDASELQQAEAYYTTAGEAFEHIGDERGLARNRMHLGNVYGRRGDLEQALTFHFNALEGFERLGNAEGKLKTLNNIGSVHQDQENWEIAVTYYERAATLAEALNEYALLTSILTNLGGALARLGSYEDAETTFRRALVIAETLEDKFVLQHIFGSLGFVFNKQGRFEGALPYLLAAEQLGNELENDRLLIPVYDELGSTYLRLERYDRAFHYATESLMLAREAGSVSDRMVAHRTLSKIYKTAGNYEQALIHHEHYVTTRDSALNEEKAEIVTEMQTRYETEEKQRAIERFEQENRIQALQRTFLLAGVGGLILLLGLLFSRYRHKQRANRLLEELDAAKSRFFANISHEFRTPLTVILGGLKDNITRRFNRDEETFIEEQHAMLRNTRQLQSLIDEVLDLNRLESGRLELQPAPGDLVRSLRRIVEADAPLAERNGIDLTFEPDSETCPRHYDQEKLEKIVGNLLSNALKFTPEGGSVQVELRCGEETEIIVSDDGPGIPAESQSTIFERFEQGEDGSHHGGTGIGLALAKELAELHGGTITLESTPGDGSIFTVQLPLEKIDSDDVGTWPRHEGGIVDAPISLQQNTEPAPPEEFPPGGDGLSKEPVVAKDDDISPDQITVLIIEDNDDVRAFVRRSLEETYRVLEAADGETGLQQTRTELPDLIVSDIMLPGIDGYEVAQRLKAEPDTECIPVVMLTARAAEEDQTEGYGSGAEVYITKPFSPETLRAAVARLLEERYRLRRRLQEAGSQTEGTDRENGEPTLADRARAVVLENLYDESFGVEELASTLNMIRRTLYNRFKLEVGLSPSDFVRTVRLEQARELLSNGAGSVSEVAYAVGFNSRVAFSRAYSAHYGAPPSDHLTRSGDATR